MSSIVTSEFSHLSSYGQGKRCPGGRGGGRVEAAGNRAQLPRFKARGEEPPPGGVSVSAAAAASVFVSAAVTRAGRPRLLAAVRQPGTSARPPPTFSSPRTTPPQLPLTPSKGKGFPQVGSAPAASETSVPTRTRRAPGPGGGIFPPGEEEGAVGPVLSRAARWTD